MPLPDALPLNQEDTRPPETINAPNVDGVVVQDPPRVLHVEDEPTTLDEAADNTPIPADIQLEYGSRIPGPRVPVEARDPLRGHAYAPRPLHTDEESWISL